MKNKKSKVVLITTLILAVLAIAGCGQKEAKADNEVDVEKVEEADNEEADVEEVEVETKVINVAFNSGIRPVAYLDEDGNPTGFEVELFKLIDEELPEYEFKYTGTTDDDLLLGLTTGQYDVGLKNSYYTKERAETYIIPNNGDGAALVGLIIRSEHKDTIKGFSDIASNGFKLNPLSPADANYSDVVAYNEENKDNQIEIEASDSLIYFTEGINWLLENRIDALLVPESHYKVNVLAEEGAYAQYKDDLAWITLYGKSTYPLFSQENQELADAYDEIYEKLDAEGKVADLLEQFLGEDTRTYVED